MVVRRRLVAASLSFACFACFSCQTSNTKILIGATARIAEHGAEVPDAVVVITGDRIQLVAQRKDAPITQASERIDLSGKWIIPAPGNRLAPNQPADLVVLNSNDPSDVMRRMKDGKWVAP